VELFLKNYFCTTLPYTASQNGQALNTAELESGRRLYAQSIKVYKLQFTSFQNFATIARSTTEQMPALVLTATAAETDS
jgi:hypothetical protein